MTAPAARPALPKRTPLIAAIGLSLLAHGALALPFVAGSWFEAAPREEKLTVELFGMVSNRQEAQQQIKVTPQASPKQAVTKSAPPPTRRWVTQTASPVQIAQTENSPSPVQAARPQQNSTNEAQPARTGAEEERVQQTTQLKEDELNQMRRYVAELTKMISSKMVYPPEARAAGYKGMPKVRFAITESGDLVPGTLTIEKSSGYAALDQSALHATQAAAPFSKPLRSMSLGIWPVFSVN